MAVWILYVLLVSLLLGLAALVFEYSALLRKKGTRWVWGASIIASLAMPIMISSVTVQIPSLIRQSPSPAGRPAVVLRQLTETTLSPSHWIAAAGQETFVWSRTTTSILIRLWASLSLLLVGGLLASGLWLKRQRRDWQHIRIAGQPVLVTDAIGPAVVGLFNPEIVVPRWLLDCPLAEQELVIAHEQSHLEANDVQLLLIALGLVVCMPWNLPLWWQLRRLRRAIEIDCDARVLRRGHDLRKYGAMLLTVGDRHAGRIGVVAAMSESKSFLDQRIRTMLRKKAKFASASALVLILLGLVLTAGAAEVSPPNADKQAHKEIAIDPKSLDGYVGIYKLTDGIFLTIAHDGPGLSAQLTGQQASPIFAESSTRFFSKLVDAQFTFVPGPDGVASSVVLHQNGADTPMTRTDEASAQLGLSRAAERFADQTPRSGSEASLRQLVEGVISGAPPYDRMSPALAKAVRQQLPAISKKLSEQGAIKSIHFVGVGRNGSDVFSVFQERGATHWQIALDDQDIIIGAFMNEGP